MVLGAILFALAGIKAVRIVISRLPDKPHRRDMGALAARKPVPPLHFVAGHPRILLTGARKDRLKAALSTSAGARLKASMDLAIQRMKQKT